MPSTFTLPGGKYVHAHRGQIILPAMDGWDEVDQGLARKNVNKDGDDAPWDRDLAAQIARWESGDFADAEGVILNPNGGKVRLGISAALFIRWRGRVVPVYGCFDPTHPGRPQHKTPFAGIQRVRDIRENSLIELGEEAIICEFLRDGRNIVGRKVGSWVYEGQPVEPEWAVNYAEAHDLQFDPDFRVEVIAAPYTTGMTQICVGEETFYGLVAFEPDTGSIEVILIYFAALPDDGIIFDGEKVPEFDASGQPTGRKVYRESPPAAMFLTDKALKVELFAWQCYHNEQEIAGQRINWTGM